MHTPLLIILITIGLVISSIRGQVYKNPPTSFILGFILVYVFSGFVTYTPDWESYENWLEEETSRELILQFTGGILLKYGYGYNGVHLIFTGIYTLLLMILISRFNNNPYLISLLYIPLIYVFYVTQIRFFLGYYSVCLAFYFFYVKKRWILSLVLLFFGLINHYSLIFIFLPFLYFLKLDLEILIKRTAATAVLVFLIFYVLKDLLNFASIDDIRFIAYLSKGAISSFIGGVYSFLPLVITLYLVNQYSKSKLIAFPDLINDDKFQFLYRFSVIPFIFIGIAFFIQIIGQRFIFPSILFQLLLVVYLSRYNTVNQNITLGAAIFSGFTFLFLYYYALPSIIIPNNSISEFAVSIIESNVILQYFSKF